MGNSTDEVVSLLTSQAEAVARLAQDNGGFSAAFAAFESKDPDGFRWVLERLDLLAYCELICEWLRVKVCVQRCTEICPIREGEQIPSLEAFARAVARLSENEEALRRVVDAVNCGDAEMYGAVLKELKLAEFCYVLCNWICSVGYRRVCERVCILETAPIADPLAEIRAAAKAMDSVLSNKKLLAALSDTAVAINCERLKSVIEEAGLLPHCEFICHLVCSYRRVWVCREICRVAPPIVTGIYAIEEARNFALALRQLTSQPRLFRDLVSAAEKPDAKAYAEIISRVGLGPYCLQVCGWVTSRICHEVCRCVCPPSVNPPLFYQVGDFDIYAQIDPGSGLTNTTACAHSFHAIRGWPEFCILRATAVRWVVPKNLPNVLGRSDDVSLPVCKKPNDACRPNNIDRTDDDPRCQQRRHSTDAVQHFGLLFRFTVRERGDHDGERSGDNHLDRGSRRGHLHTGRLDPCRRHGGYQSAADHRLISRHTGSGRGANDQLAQPFWNNTFARLFSDA